MRRRDVLIGTGAAVLATQIPAVQANPQVYRSTKVDTYSWTRENRAYTVYKDHDGRGNDLHCYRGHYVLVGPEIQGDLKSKFGQSFDRINKFSVDIFVDDKCHGITIKSQKGPDRKIEIYRHVRSFYDSQNPSMLLDHLQMTVSEEV